MTESNRPPASIPPIPANEEERLETLHRLDILGTAADPAFDDILALARQITGASMGAISFVDEACQWFKSKAGFDSDQTPREDAFCAHAINDDSRALLVEDTLLDERFKEHPLVLGPPHLRFYAGFPLVIDGSALGTLCVFGDEPYALSDSEREALEALRNQVEDQLRLRLALGESERLREEAAKRTRQLEQAQRQLAQVEKVNSLGRMAGGIAHDFNNIMTIISTCAGFLTDSLEPGSQSHEDARDIAQGVQRASALTRQLLAFSRSQVLEPRVINLDETVQPIEQLMSRVLEANVTLQTHLEAGDVSIYADSNQLEQVLLNLFFNARDAVEGYGDIIVETARVELSEGEHARVPAGTYGVVRVKDNGVGIAADKLDEVFEPFFSDKKSDQGTGLGLATVQGIVSQSGGFIDVQSEPGVGSEFSIWLPVVDRHPNASSDSNSPSESSNTPGGHGDADAAKTILLVEDEPLVRKSFVRILQSANHVVIEAENPEVALRKWKEHRDQIDAVVSDIVMPIMRGPKLVAKLRQDRPTLPVLFVTGYTDHAEVDTSVEAPTAVLHKPIKMRNFLQRLSELLAQAKPLEATTTSGV